VAGCRGLQGLLIDRPGLTHIFPPYPSKDPSQATQGGEEAEGLAVPDQGVFTEVGGWVK